MRESVWEWSARVSDSNEERESEVSVRVTAVVLKYQRDIIRLRTARCWTATDSSKPCHETEALYCTLKVVRLITQSGGITNISFTLLTLKRISL